MTAHILCSGRGPYIRPPHGRIHAADFTIVWMFLRFLLEGLFEILLNLIVLDTCKATLTSYFAVLGSNRPLGVEEGAKGIESDKEFTASVHGLSRVNGIKRIKKRE